MVSIARTLSCHCATISRELERNIKVTEYNCPYEAQRACLVRRTTSEKHRISSEMIDFTRTLIEIDWSLSKFLMYSRAVVFLLAMNGFINISMITKEKKRHFIAI
ncbi:hypothetical protein OAH87_05360 [Marinomonas sp.]|nr:hypothetical protein [Marinomonas sp.]MDB4837880.1 hypothetical protein [Marinomonas sp.]